MTWRPTRRPELISDPYKEPIAGYKVTVNDGDGNASPPRVNTTYTSISSNGQCAEITVTGDMFYKLGSGCTRTSFDGYIKSDGADRVRIAFPKNNKGIPQTNMSFILAGTGAGENFAYITLFNQET